MASFELLSFAQRPTVGRDFDWYTYDPNYISPETLRENWVKLLRWVWVYGRERQVSKLNYLKHRGEQAPFTVGRVELRLCDKAASQSQPKARREQKSLLRRALQRTIPSGQPRIACETPSSDLCQTLAHQSANATKPLHRQILSPLIPNAKTVQTGRQRNATENRKEKAEGGG